MTINKGYTVINKPLSSEYYQTTSHVMKTRDHIFRLGINTILGWPFCPPKISFDYILLTLGTGLSLKSTQRMIFSQFSDLWKWHWNEGFFIIKGIFDRNIFPGNEFSGELFPGIFPENEFSGIDLRFEWFEFEIESNTIGCTPDYYRMINTSFIPCIQCINSCRYIRI